MSLDSERENKAAEALISGALHPFSKEISDEEVKEFLESGCTLSAAGNAALVKLGDDPLSDITPKAEASPDPALAGEFAAMHRDLAADETDEETKAELARRRKEIIERIRERRKQSE